MRVACRQHDGRQQIALRDVRIRNFATDKHFSVAHTPKSSWAGMLLKHDLLVLALDNAWPAGRPIVAITAQGKPIDPDGVKQTVATPSTLFNV